MINEFGKIATTFNFFYLHFGISKLEEEHNQALELTANRAALVRKELESLQQETGKMK